jgi:hypothetical protein
MWFPNVGESKGFEGFILRILVMIQNLFKYVHSCIQGIPYENTFGLEWNIPTPTFGFGSCYGY